KIVSTDSLVFPLDEYTRSKPLSVLFKKSFIIIPPIVLFLNQQPCISHEILLLSHVYLSLVYHTENFCRLPDALYMQHKLCFRYLSTDKLNQVPDLSAKSHAFVV